MISKDNLKADVETCFHCPETPTVTQNAVYSLPVVYGQDSKTAKEYL